MLEGGRVDAVPEPGGFWAVVELMPKVRPTICAYHFNPPHSPRVVRYLFDRLLPDGVPEAWPTCPGVELCVGAEELIAADDALVDAVLVEVPKSAGEGPFGRPVKADVVLLPSKLRLQLLLHSLPFLLLEHERMKMGHRALRIHSSGIDPALHAEKYWQPRIEIGEVAKPLITVLDLVE
jgi:hypothetical protein